MNKLKNAAIKVACEEQKRYEKEKEEINYTRYWHIYLIIFIILLSLSGYNAIYEETPSIDFLESLLGVMVGTSVFAFVVYRIVNEKQLLKERKVEKKYVRNINTSLSTYQKTRDILNRELKKDYYIKNFIILNSNFDNFVIISYFDYQNKNSFIVLCVNDEVDWWKPRQNKFESEPSIFKSKKDKDRSDNKNLKRLYYLFEKHLEN